VRSSYPQLFRFQLSELLDRYDAVFVRLGNDLGRARVAEARTALASVTDANLGQVFARSGVPDLTPAVVAAEGLLAVTPPPARPPMKQLYRDRLLRTFDLPGAPAVLADCDNIQHDSAFVFGALIAWQVARGILEAAEFGCLETVVVLGEGGNGAAACIPLAIAKDAAAIPFELGSFCAGEEDSAVLQGTYERVAAVYEELGKVRDDLVADAAANRDVILADAAANRAAIVANDDANRATIMANDDANRDAIMANANGNRDLIINEVRALSCELARLLATPEGRRESSVPACMGQPGFPYAFPEK